MSFRYQDAVCNDGVGEPS